MPQALFTSLLSGPETGIQRLVILVSSPYAKSRVSGFPCLRRLAQRRSALVRVASLAVVWRGHWRRAHPMARALELTLHRELGRAARPVCGQASSPHGVVRHVSLDS